MSANVTQTVSFGIREGPPFNDAVDVGGFPHAQDIRTIKQIRLYAGGLVDAMEVTYRMNDGSIKVVPHHGQPWGPNVTINFNDSEVLISVTGKTTLPGQYENKPYLNFLKFVILDTSNGNVRVEGPFGCGTDPSAWTGQPFSVVGPIVAFAGQQRSVPNANPQNALTLSFIKSEKLAQSHNIL